MAQLSFLDEANAGEDAAANDNTGTPTRRHRARVAGTHADASLAGVYFLASANQRRVKIGKSRHLNGRVVDIANMNPHGLSLLVTVPGGYTSTESWFHRKFAPQRLHGEWFAVDDSIRSMVKLLRSGTVPPDVLAEVERDIEDEKERSSRERAAATERRSYPVAPRALPISNREFKSVSEIVEHWQAAGGPTLSETVEMAEDADEILTHLKCLKTSDGAESRDHTRGHSASVGNWIDPGGRIMIENDFSGPGPWVLADALARSSPEQRLYRLIAASVFEFSREDRVRSHGDARYSTSRLIHSTREGGYLGGNTKYWLPGSWDCRRECRTCHAYPVDTQANHC